MPGEGGQLPLVNDKVPLIDHEPDQVRGGVPHITPLSDVLLFEHHGEDILKIALCDSNCDFFLSFLKHSHQLIIIRFD